MYFFDYLVNWGVWPEVHGVYGEAKPLTTDSLIAIVDRSMTRECSHV